MEDESAPLTDDPEILALLDFEPVPRKCRRRNGWTPGSQRGFIRGVADTGDADLAAQAMGLTARGAYDLRKSPGHEPFFAAWDQAAALHKARKAGPGGARAPAAAAPEDDEARWDGFADRILVPYMMKLGQERAARLAGRIVEADFYVRQLTWLEVALDLGGGGAKALKMLERGDHHAGQIVATPMSVLLGEVRRAVWAKMDEPDRPPPPSLGRHDDEISTGEPLECQHDPARDGDHQGRRERAAEREAIAAEAQRAWEKKAKADAAAWRARVDGTAATGDADGTEPGP